MDPPSTPAPIALRGRHLDRALRDVDSQRPELDAEMPASIRIAEDPRRTILEAERFAREALESPISDAPPMTMRGDALERVLEGARSTPRSSKLRPTRH